MCGGSLQLFPKFLCGSCVALQQSGDDSHEDDTKDAGVMGGICSMIRLKSNETTFIEDAELQSSSILDIPSGLSNFRTSCFTKNFMRRVN